MNLIAQRKTKTGEIQLSLSAEMLGVIPDIMKSFLTEKDNRGENDFEVDELISFIRKRFPDIEPFKSSENRSSVRERASGKKIIDVQDVTYHLSGPQSFWIIDTSNNKKIILFERLKKMKYLILKNWREYF